MIKKQIPPLTIRFCLVCNKETYFKHNPIIGHSECTICGARFASKYISTPSEKQMMEKLLKLREDLINKINKNKKKRVKQFHIINCQLKEVITKINNILELDNNE